MLFLLLKCESFKTDESWHNGFAYRIGVNRYNCILVLVTLTTTATGTILKYMRFALSLCNNPFKSRRRKNFQQNV